MRDILLIFIVFVVFIFTINKFSEDKDKLERIEQLKVEIDSNRLRIYQDDKFLTELKSQKYYDCLNNDCFSKNFIIEFVDWLKNKKEDNFTSKELLDKWIEI